MLLTLEVLRISRVFTLDSKRPRHGYELAKSPGIKRWKVYATLEKLEDAGWLRSEVETGYPSEMERPARRVYSITPYGIAEAEKAWSILMTT